jgi:5-enolpyruvylshikimate-3-phosphate synthase
LKAIDLDCNHIPDAAMTLAVMALFADTHPRCGIRQLARQGNRPHCSDGHASCAR